MDSFTDKTGRSWKIELTVGTMEKVKDALKIDLFDPVNEDTQLIAELAPISAKNIMLFVDMLYVLCEEQCKQPKVASSIPPNTDWKEITSAQFGMQLGGDALKGAYEAFYKEWEGFFQSLGRKDLAEVIKRMNELIQEGVDNVVQKIKEITMEGIKSQTISSATS